MYIPCVVNVTWLSTSRENILGGVNAQIKRTIDLYCNLYTWKMLDAASLAICVISLA